MRWGATALRRRVAEGISPLATYKSRRGTGGVLGEEGTSSSAAISGLVTVRGGEEWRGVVLGMEVVMEIDDFLDIMRGGNGAKKRLSLEIYFLVVRYFRLE